MKNKTLIIVTASIITVTAVILTAGLSLLHSSAIENEPTPMESVIPVSQEVEPIIEEASQEQKLAENVLYYKDMVFDIYEQETGKLVGQVVVTDDDIYTQCGELYIASRENGRITAFDPNDENSQPVYLPKAKYRVEAHSMGLVKDRDNGNISSQGGYFEIAFSYGAEGIMCEFLQTGLTFYTSQEFMNAVNSIVANEIAAIEAGTAEAPETEMMSIVGYDKEDGYWNKIGRYTPRFPYLAD